MQKRGILGNIQNRLSRNRIGEVLVQKGVLSPLHLKSALEMQRVEGLPLGKILTQHQMISEVSLRMALYEQVMLRILATIITIMIAYASFAPKIIRAAEIRDIPVEISLSQGTDNQFTPLSYYPALFGSLEKKSQNLRPFTKWSSMFDRLDKEMSNPSNQAIIATWKQELSKYRSTSIYAMAAKVDKYVNKQAYINDSKLWGQSDYWATPIEFFTRGGDCEDFAIAKYASLRALGVPEDRMRLAIVHDQQKNIPHAVLIVYTERGLVLLDNQSKNIKNASSVTHYKPIFSINRTAWWLHTKPSLSDDLQVATAAQ